ncbi:MAG: serine hydrolase domain-containing protein [Kosmotogaceae bacterium]
MLRLMKYLIPAIFFTWIMAISCYLSALGATYGDKPLEELIAHLEHRIPALMDSYNIPGVAIALVEDGETAWVKAYGHADLEEGRIMTSDTYCRVQSISKSVTAWGVMKLVEQGKVDLDSPYLRYLTDWTFPDSEYPVDEITVRQLLSLSAGMPLGNVVQRFSPTDEVPSIRTVLSEEAIAFREPGTSFHYSNVSINLLELLIEEVSDRDFADYIQEEILTPLGMHHSSYKWSKDFEPPVPNGYDLKNRPVPVYVYAGRASGGLFASAEDIASFISAGMTGPYHKNHGVLKPETIEMLYMPQVEMSGFYAQAFDYYGLGHLIEILPDGTTAVSHGGQGAGIMTHFHSVPEDGRGIVILTNSQRSWPLIGYILDDWAEWAGYGSIGMGKIIWGKNILRVLVGLIFLLALWQAFRICKELYSGSRKYISPLKELTLLRALQFLCSTILIAGLLWAITRPYLNITSLMPVVSVWLGYTILIAALVMLGSALFTATGQQK